MLRICCAFVLAAFPVVASADLSGSVRVIDADTWDVGGTRVRLHGIDAPELDQTCTRASGQGWDCGAWATQQVRSLYDGHAAQCTRVTQDRYGRMVARCRVQGDDVGQALVSQGLAFAFRKYSTDYVGAENHARSAAMGLHGARVVLPWDHRAANRTTDHPANCRIKGNISAKGERIFHHPGQPHYSRTRISTAKGERWFCTADEARRAGWRAAKN
ncbi:Succinoglycan biosynthesis protein ExoI [Falsiruegeria litorea R37]|uniref:Succinoglycan biosynthesis protein ExoI n=1 Tax=Falsiruegeria litorea R37 TaxID=1200284 RepID=A0A1Y5S3B6_9RHOB|nr:thermonuclease family protein [Falsiruegeria litorea]SLN31770.1 Succinoglycan biosynthesis protein ExoI [Falsiruegeria litorea R37]